MSAGLDQASGTFARFPTPRRADTLCWHLRDAGKDAGTIKGGLEGRPAFCSRRVSSRTVFLWRCWMPDDTMGPPMLVHPGGRPFTPTIEKVSFIAPAPPGLLIGRGRIVHVGQSIAFLEGSLLNAEETLVATSSAPSRLLPTSNL